MNWVDLTFLGICLFSLQLGFQKGLIRQTSIIISIILGIILAGRLHVPLAKTKPFLIIAEKYSENGSIIMAYVGIFLVTICTFQLFSFFLRRSIQAGTLGRIDNLFGALLGIGKAYLFFAVISLSVFNLFPGEDISKHFSQSYAVPKIVSSFRGLISRIPVKYRDQFNNLIAHQKTVQAKVKRFCYADNRESIPIWAPVEKKRT